MWEDVQPQLGWTLPHYMIITPARQGRGGEQVMDDLCKERALQVEGLESQDAAFNARL